MRVTLLFLVTLVQFLGESYGVMEKEREGEFLDSLNELRKEVVIGAEDLVPNNEVSSKAAEFSKFCTNETLKTFTDGEVVGFSYNQHALVKAMITTYNSFADNCTYIDLLFGPNNTIKVPGNDVCKILKYMFSSNLQNGAVSIMRNKSCTEMGAFNNTIAVATAPGSETMGSLSFNQTVVEVIEEEVAAEFERQDELLRRLLQQNGGQNKMGNKKGGKHETGKRN